MRRADSLARGVVLSTIEEGHRVGLGPIGQSSRQGKQENLYEKRIEDQ